MENLWLYLTAGAALINWAAVEKNWKSIELVTKPGTLIALMIWLWAAAGFQGPLLFFGLALIFSLAGDVLLMLPKRLFIAGLISFLLAHVFYIIGFNIPLPPLSLVSLLMAVFVGFIARNIYQRLAAGLVRTGQAHLLKPFLIYASAISLMLLSALLTTARSDWKLSASLLASAGALLFFLSDSCIAWDMCISPLSHRGLKVMITYHLGQLGIIAGAIVQFAN